MAALLMDIGNSRLKWGVLDDQAIRRTGHISQARIRELGLTALTSKLPRRVDTVFASNVAGTSFATRVSGCRAAPASCPVASARRDHRPTTHSTIALVSSGHSDARPGDVS